MVTDLTRSSTELRKRVPELLEKLVASGTVLRVENEYRMQTKARAGQAAQRYDQERG